MLEEESRRSTLSRSSVVSRSPRASTIRVPVPRNKQLPQPSQRQPQGTFLDRRPEPIRKALPEDRVSPGNVIWRKTEEKPKKHLTPYEAKSRKPPTTPIKSSPTSSMGRTLSEQDLRQIQQTRKDFESPSGQFRSSMSLLENDISELVQESELLITSPGKEEEVNNAGTGSINPISQKALGYLKMIKSIFIESESKDVAPPLKVTNEPSPVTSSVQETTVNNNEPVQDVKGCADGTCSINVSPKKSAMKRKASKVSILPTLESLETMSSQLHDLERSRKLEAIRRLEEFAKLKRQELASTRKRIRLSLEEEIENNKRLEKILGRIKAIRLAGERGAFKDSNEQLHFAKRMIDLSKEQVKRLNINKE